MKYSTKTIICSMVLGLGAAHHAFAADSLADSLVADPAALTIAEVKTEKVDESPAAQIKALSQFQQAIFSDDVMMNPLADDDGPSVEVIFDKIVNLGQKIWDLVAKGKPVVNVNLQSASAMPQGIDNWLLMDGWSAPRTQLYHFSVKNLYGITVIDFTYRILYISGGSYQNKGKYLARVTVQPENLYVAWGYTFEANTAVPSVLNVGSAEAPVGGAEVDVNWHISTIMNDQRGSGSYFVNGNGDFRNSDR